MQDIPGMPMERMAVDLMGPLPKTESGNLYIAVVVDYFTKWAEAFALPNKQSQTVAEVLMTGVICQQGALHRLHSDQGGKFESLDGGVRTPRCGENPHDTVSTSVRWAGGAAELDHQEDVEGVCQ